MPACLSAACLPACLRLPVCLPVVLSFSFFARSSSKATHIQQLLVWSTAHSLGRFQSKANSSSRGTTALHPPHNRIGVWQPTDSRALKAPVNKQTTTSNAILVCCFHFSLSILGVAFRPPNSRQTLVILPFAVGSLPIHTPPDFHTENNNNL